MKPMLLRSYLPSPPEAKEGADEEQVRLETSDKPKEEEEGDRDSSAESVMLLDLQGMCSPVTMLQTVPSGQGKM